MRLASKPLFTDQGVPGTQEGPSRQRTVLLATCRQALHPAVGPILPQTWSLALIPQKETPLQQQQARHPLGKLLSDNLFACEKLVISLQMVNSQQQSQGGSACVVGANLGTGLLSGEWGKGKRQQQVPSAPSASHSTEAGLSLSSLVPGPSPPRHITTAYTELLPPLHPNPQVSSFCAKPHRRYTQPTLNLLHT